MSEAQINNTGDVAGQVAGELVAAGKGFLRSKTIWGLLITGVVLAGQGLFNMNVSADTAASVAGSLVDLLCYLLEVGGLALAAYGRKVADGPLGKAKTVTPPSAGAAAAGLVLLLVLAAGSAQAGEGLESLTSLSLWAYALNLAYAMGGFTLLLAFWFGVVDRRVLKGFDTRAEIAAGNLAVAIYAGLSLVALALVVGLSLG